MQLTILFIDEEYRLDPEERFAFGRSGDLEVDSENLYMHRTVGTFRFHQGVWWLHNEAATATIEIVSGDGFLTVVPAGQSTALSQAFSTIRFEFGQMHYELECRLGIEPLPEVDEISPDTGLTTLKFGNVRLNEEQRLMLTAFAADSLRSSRLSDTLPSTAEVANLLGWTVKKVTRKLDYLCVRLAETGVSGLRGQLGDDATDRRRRLVEHAVNNALISARDLDELDRFVETRQSTGD